MMIKTFPVSFIPGRYRNNCTSYAVLIRTAGAYSVAQNIVYSGVRLPATHEFDVSLSKIRMERAERSTSS